MSFQKLTKENLVMDRAVLEQIQTKHEWSFRPVEVKGEGKESWFHLL